MPIYKLKIGDTDAGKLQVNNANGSTTWSYKPPNGNGFNALNPAPVYTGSNVNNPSPGDGLNISGCTGIPNAPANGATYADPNGNKKAGYYYAGTASLTGAAPGSWDAEDSGDK